MSHSRIEAGDRRERDRRGMSQLVQMMRSGRSFSGREPHCAFLNEGPPA